jgi:hypothetical protein
MRLAAGYTTLVGCGGDLGLIEQLFERLIENPLGWEIHGRRLTLTSGRMTLAYVVRDPVYPNRWARTVVAGEHNGAQYRFAAGLQERQAIGVFEFRTRPGQGWAVGEEAAPEFSSMTARAETVAAGLDLLHGFVPAEVRRVVIRTARGGRPGQLTLASTPDARWQTFAGVLPTLPHSTTVQALDGSGRVRFSCTFRDLYLYRTTFQCRRGTPPAVPTPRKIGNWLP